MGRAGAGKTYGCLEAIARELQRSPRGLPLLLLSPEQSTAQLERRLATWPALLGGATRARVFSFLHLAREAFIRGGGTPGSQLGDVGRIMLLRQALRRRQGELAALGSSASQPGVAETLSQTLLEFQHYGWRRADLESWIATQGKSEGEQSLTVRKMRDLSLLWRDYEEALARGGWEDPARMFEAAAAAIRRAHWLERAWIWVDGFASFTALELTVFEALLAKAERVTIALCLDPGHLRLKEQAGGGLRPRLGPERFFENIEETYTMLRDRLRSLGLPEDRITITALPAPGQPVRPTTPALAHLERRVLGRLHPEPCPDETWDASRRTEDALAPPPIELIEASDRRAEVEAVARRIVTACRRDPSAAAPPRSLLLWREVAVLARDLAPYAVHLREVFAAFKIPYFLDRPRAVQGHPLARSILSALAVLRAGWSGESVLHHLKSGLCALTGEDGIGMLENVIRATDPRGALWLRAVERQEALLPLWRQAAAPLRRLEEDLRTTTPPRAIWNYLDAVRAATRLEGWVAEAQAAGDEESAQLHEQAWEQTVAWLEEFEKIQQATPPGEAGRPAREKIQELMDLVEAALASTQARLIPPTLNQVTVGAVDRSRTPEVKALFVLGLNDGEFPRLWQPDAMLGDEERDALALGGRRLGPDTSRKRLQEHFLAYIALTRSAERLVLSRPQVDDEGRVCNPSPYFALIARNFPRAPLRELKRAGAGDQTALPLRPEEWALCFGLMLAQGAPGEVDRALAGGATLLTQPEIEDPARRALDLARARLEPPRAAALAPALALRFWQGGATLPVTALESFGECPFKFFASRMLRLEARQEAALNVRELGTLRHELLNRLFIALRGEEGLDWGRVDAAGADPVIDRELERLRSEDAWRGRLEASALGGMTLDEIGAEIKLFIRAAIAVGRRSRFIQAAAEWSFGARGEMAIQAGPHRFALRGTIDRVDALPRGDGLPPAALLIDYKSGSRKINLARIMEGLDLQLPAYALAWRQANTAPNAPGPRIGGMFYWPLTAPVGEAAPGDGASGDGVDERWFERQKPSGIFAAEMAGLLDAEVGPEGRSLAFGFSKTKGGALNDRSQSHWPAAKLQLLLAHGQRVMERWAEAIVAGEIAAAPCLHGHDLSCDRCDYAPLCRKADPVPLGIRRIANLKRDEALARLEHDWPES